MDNMQRNFAVYVQISALPVVKSVKDIHRWNIAGNVQKLAGSVQKNAGRWPRQQFN
jgi:hypothetical protein